MAKEKNQLKEVTEYVMKHNLSGKTYIVTEDYVEKLLSVGYSIIEKKGEPPFDPDPPKPGSTNSDGTKTSPMSRAKQLAQLALKHRKQRKADEGYVSHAQRKAVWANKADGGKGHPDNKKNEATVDTAAIASKKAMKKSDTEKLGKLADMLAKERKPQKESVELDEAHAYAKAAKALHDYGTKNGGIDKKDFHAAAKHLDNVGKSGLMQKGTHLAKFNNHIKGLDTDVRDRIHMTLKQHGVMESVNEAAYGTQAQRMMSPLQKIRQDKEKADRDRDGKLKSTALPMRKKKEEVEEAGSPERYKMIKKAGDKYNKEKKKAERDAMKAMSKDKDMMGESDVSELKKSTLGSYVNKASKDAASKAYSAASAAKDNNTEKGGKDFSKSMKRLRGINTATKKLAKEDTNEAKSFDQKFKDHLKFATSKSKAVQDYMKKRAADRDAMNKKNDPNAAKKGYALTAVPPERKYQKLQKAKKAGKA